MMADKRKVLIWGTGKNTVEFCDNGVNGCIVGFIETHKTKSEFRNMPVYGIDEMWPEHDCVVVTTVYSGEIYTECVDRRFDLDKFIFLYPISIKSGEKRPDKLKTLLKEKNYAKYCINHGICASTFFADDLQKYQETNTRQNFCIDSDNLWPIITDKYAASGNIGNYFWQDLWAAKLIIGCGTKKHFDIGSRLDGFIAHLLSAGIEVEMIDVREFPGQVEHLHTIVDDATTLHQIPDESIESMSALCSLEHFGLGRYGDPIDPEACFKCFDNIQRKLKKGGRLYISLPVGRERVEFNAHRVFYASTVIECFKTLRLKEFSCTSQGELERDVDIHKYDHDPHDGEWRYGLFHFIK